jgi:hypothetical protein
MPKLKKKGLTDVGFMDLNRTFKDMVTPCDRWRPQVENNLFRFLDNQHDKRLILFPYNFK